jgi:hypothetical protein
MAFLSLLDDRAKPKGSRDPLGFELVWTHYGRQVIGNLTTITSSLNNFAVALLGFRWANEIHRHLPQAEKQARIRETFLRYEQLAGYLRYQAKNEDIMGITRVSTRIGNPKFSISLGLNADQQILSDQASYGLWGLYSAAMKESGLIYGDERDPTELGNSIAQRIERKLDKSALIALLNSSKYVSRDILASQGKPFFAAIKNRPAQNLLLKAVMNGTDKSGLQQELWSVTRSIAETENLGPDVPTFIKQVKKETNNNQLIQQLQNIESVERILVAANNLFHYCRLKDGEQLNNILTVLKNRYTYIHLSKNLDLSDIPRADHLIKLRGAMLSNRPREAIRELFNLNKIVMGQRGGAPWIELEANNILRVRVQSETAELTDQKGLESRWDYNYFLESYVEIAARALGAEWTTP